MSEHFIAYILAGGQSRRFPGDKALAQIDGRSQLVRLCERLNQLGHTVRLVVDRIDRYQKELSIPAIVDFAPGEGPLAGVITALRHQTEREPGWVLVMGCDQFLWKDSWSSVHRGLQPDCLPAALLWPSSDRFSPIPGWYHTRGLPVLEKLWEQGSRALRDMANCPSFEITWLAEIDEHPAQFAFNTPRELSSLIAGFGS